MADSPAPDKPTPPPQFLLGRLFVVPLIIVGVIVTCAVVVVLSFGAISSNREMTIDKLLAVLEADPGEKTAGMLMPRAKEMWQAAQELALRLENLDTEVTPEELPEIQRRLAQLLERELAAPLPMGENHRQRLSFIMQAAARARAPQAVPVLAGALTHQDPNLRREATGALALMKAVPGVEAQLPVLGDQLRDPDPVIRLVTLAALSRLATAQDAAVIDRITRAYHIDEDQDVRWNAALTLARLGSTEAAPALTEMLTRDYWQRQRVHYIPASGAEVNRPFTPNVIDEHLIVTMDASRGLDDQVIWQYIDKLQNDPSSKVAARARVAIAERPLPGSED